MRPDYRPSTNATDTTTSLPETPFASLSLLLSLVFPLFLFWSRNLTHNLIAMVTSEAPLIQQALRCSQH